MSSKSESELSHVVKFALLELVAVVIGLIFVRKEVYMAGKFGEMVLHWQEYAMLLLVLIDGLVRGRARSLYASPFRKKILRYLLPFALFLYVACSSLCDKLNVACIHEEWFRSSGLFILGLGVCFLVWTQRTRPVALLLYFQKSSHESWLSRDFADDSDSNAEKGDASATDSLLDNEPGESTEQSSGDTGLDGCAENLKKGCQGIESNAEGVVENSGKEGYEVENPKIDENKGSAKNSVKKFFDKDNSDETSSADEDSEKKSLENVCSETEGSGAEDSETEGSGKEGLETEGSSKEGSDKGSSDKGSSDKGDSGTEDFENKSSQSKDADYIGDSYATKEISRALEADKTPSRKEAWKKEQAESNIEDSADKPVFVYEELRGPWRFLRYPGRTAILLELVGISITLSTWLPLITLPGLIVLFKWELADVEAFRISQFGSAYVDYKEKSWLLIPYIF